MKHLNRKNLFNLLTLVIGLTVITACSNGFRSRTVAQAEEEAALAFLEESNRRWEVEGHNSAGKCASCHTTMGQAMVQPAHGQSEQMNRVRLMTEERVKIFKEEGFRGLRNKPWYEIERSFSTESVVNASTLVFLDKGAEREVLSQSAEDALEIMWKRQITEPGSKKGGFMWLDQFAMAPMEDANSPYWGSAMAAVTTGNAPDEYRTRANVQENISELKKYLARDLENQTPHNQLMALWANHELGGGIVNAEQEKRIIKDILGRADSGGGWSIHSLLANSSSINNNLRKAEGYGTGYVTNILLKIGYHEKREVKKGLKWIRGNQGVVSTGVLPDGRPACGSWVAVSPRGGAPSRYLTDISTSYSILALRSATKLGI
ncbi:MAG: hypothetical protein ACI9QD_001077 [Thermoproteota archaeon]|jgi:hypothetical protein